MRILNPLSKSDRRTAEASQVARGPLRLTPRPPGSKETARRPEQRSVPSETVALVVVAAGRGTRLGAERPKQYLPCAGKPLLAHTLEALVAAWPFSAVVVAIRGEDRGLYDETLAHLTPDAAAALGPPAI